MILQALYEYYGRKTEIQTPIGYEHEELDFIVQLKEDGSFVDLLNMRENKHGHPYLIPKAVIRTAAPKPNLLWDKFEYVFGISKDEKKKNKAKDYNKEFVERINNLPQNIKSDTGVRGITLFYERNQIKEIMKHPVWEECMKISGWISFQLEGDLNIIPMREKILEYQAKEFLSGKYEEDKSGKIKEGICIVTGDKEVIKRVNTEFRLPGSDKNVKLVSFQLNSGFDSYYKEQAFNAPISIEAESAYSTALKHLISSSTNKKIIGDTTVLFWSEKVTSIINPEEIFSWVVAAQKSDEDNPDKGTQIINSLYDAVFTGQLPKEKNNHFYVLGLAPNAARISVRFWKMPSVEEFGKNIKQHFDDINIVHGPKEPEHLSLYQILSSTALAYKMENVPPNLTGAVIESIIDGTPYPSTLLQQCIRRIRAEQTVNRSRAAILKAYLNRSNRIYKPKEKELTMSLDLTSTNSGYLTGRLFAVLEKIQEEANPGINTTIKDRYYGAASSTPVAVFSQLLKLKNHHIPKLSPGRKIYFEKLIGEIMCGINSFPANLALNDQAYFAIGYYHQRQDFFTGKSNKNESEIQQQN